MTEPIISMDPYYEKQLENYDDELDMCNQLGLNIHDIYDYTYPE